MQNFDVESIDKFYKIQAICHNFTTSSCLYAKLVKNFIQETFLKTYSSLFDHEIYVLKFRLAVESFSLVPMYESLMLHTCFIKFYEENT